MTDMSMWVITQNPADFPGKFVAREHLIGVGMTRATANHHVADSLVDVRQALPPGLYRLKPSRADDPVIVESWL